MGYLCPPFQSRNRRCVSPRDASAVSRGRDQPSDGNLDWGSLGRGAGGADARRGLRLLDALVASCSGVGSWACGAVLPIPRLLGITFPCARRLLPRVLCPPSIHRLKAPVGVLMDDASQAFCVLAGGKGYLRDSMVSAMLAKNQVFPSTNLLVVPVDMTERPAGGGTGGGKGFGKAPAYENEGYVAAPVEVGTRSFVLVSGW